MQEFWPRFFMLIKHSSKARFKNPGKSDSALDEMRQINNRVVFWSMYTRCQRLKESMQSNASCFSAEAGSQQGHMQMETHIFQK